MKRLAALCVAMNFVAWPAHAAPPSGACRNPEPAHPVVNELPWAQKSLDQRRAWPHSTGADVLVAVIDSGVDADHPQLRAAGKVLRGEDFHLLGDYPGSFDCVSHGTAAAAIIAATPLPGIGFHGVAPDARILPVRVTDREVNDSGSPTPIDPVVLARGIWYAADAGAKVINLSLSGYGDHQVVHDAIRHAQDKDALVVAAVGNRQQQGAAASYPAMYDGVLGVGAVEITGTRTADSQIGPYVDLMAPGKGVLAATRVDGHAYFDGTSFAAPYVAGTAALVRAAWPDLKAPDVARRLMATATPGPGNAHEYGAGIVDPYRAVTDGLTTRSPAAMAPVVTPAPDAEALRAAARSELLRTRAQWLAALVGAAILLVVLIARVLGNGRRRRWLPGRAAPLPAAARRDEPAEEIFLFPPPASER
ncbi:peptidase S8 [Lentzea aerocolonigenes]|uniref:Peptidase S8 n=1 Tax=Lentzea aerocolonigenes TaxID=68170 RepID=A0A0F0GIU8_LENAE|nr:type VII secretion-associated serine protease mycosin [Lentzea aerocolonigenes]KJK43429.1 peptidase S8 [Lentzea aerocolonigenes]